MATEIPTCEPTSIVAGDTVKWTRSLADYSYADGWRLKYGLRGVSKLDITTTADADGVGFAVTISAGDTGKLEAGQYQLLGWVELNGENYTVIGPQPVTVTPNYQTAAAGDLRPSAEIELELCEAQIKELLSSSNETYSIGQRSAQKRKLEDLYKTRGILIAKLGRQRGQSNPTQAVRFRAAR